EHHYYDSNDPENGFGRLRHNLSFHCCCPVDGGPCRLDWDYVCQVGQARPVVALSLPAFAGALDHFDASQSGSIRRREEEEYCSPPPPLVIPFVVPVNWLPEPLFSATAGVP